MKNFLQITAFLALLAGFFACKPTQTSTTSNDKPSEEVSDAKPVSMDLSPYRKVPEKTLRTTGSEQKNETNNVKIKDTEKAQILNKPASSPLTGHQNDLAESKIEEARVFNASILEGQGYRLQLYSGNEREEAEKILKKAKSWVSSADAPMLVYEQPNYKIKVGNFINKLDAYQLFTVLNKEFPGTLIISDLIDLEKLRKKHQK